MPFYMICKELFTKSTFTSSRTRFENEQIKTKKTVEISGFLN